MKALRFDISRLDAPRRDQNGYLEAEAAVTRVGVFVYRHPDGSVTRELRHPDEVFKADSLATLRNRPITNGHPVEGKLTTKNTKYLAVGTAVGDVKHDERLVTTRLQIIDEDVISKVLDSMNPLREVSCGYEAEVEPATGTFNGEHYDHIQKNIVYNHVALVPRGRAGSDVRVRVDGAAEMDDDADISIEVPEGLKAGASADGVKVEKRGDAHQVIFAKSSGWTLDKAKSWVENHKRTKSDADDKPENRQMIKIKRDAVRTRTFKSDGFEVKLEGSVDKDEAAVQVVLDKLDESRNHILKLEGENDRLQARVDSLQDAGKVNVSQLHKLVRERSDACAAAMYLGLKGYDALETADLKKAVVLKAFPNLHTDQAGLTPDYIEGRYESILDRIRQENKNLESLANLKSVSQNPDLFAPRADDLSPRDRLAKETSNMWERKPSDSSAAAA